MYCGIGHGGRCQLGGAQKPRPPFGIKVEIKDGIAETVYMKNTAGHLFRVEGVFFVSLGQGVDL